jgi:hypothetical protein
MLSKIEKYYQQLGLNPFLVKKKLSKLQRHPDIAEEFALWIGTKEYKQQDCAVANGYTAQSLATLSSVLDGEAAFLLLIELRDDSERAINRISNGLFIL